jgi:hypothetical protein
MARGRAAARVVATGRPPRGAGCVDWGAVAADKVGAAEEVGEVGEVGEVACTAGASRTGRAGVSATARCTGGRAGPVGCRKSRITPAGPSRRVGSS